jgi:hypothetical protein
VALQCAQGVVYVIAIGLMLRMQADAKTLVLVLAVALLLRAVAVSVPPFLSNDLYRYIWDGWVQSAGINPYRYIPADAHLAALRDATVFPNINRANYAHTIYPPAAEAVFFAADMQARLLHLGPVLGMRLAMLGLEAIGVLAMLQLLAAGGLPRARVLIYAWNPLPVWEFAGNGHVDAIAVCGIALALLAACESKRAWSAAALAGAVLAKFLPLVLLPAIWRRWDWRFAGVFVAVIFLLYLPYLSVGRGVLGFLNGYGAQEGIVSGQGLFLLAALGQMMPLPQAAPAVYLAGLVGVLGVLAARMLWGAQPVLREDRVRLICRRAVLLGCVAMAGLSPHYPWYYAWLLIPACVTPFSSVIYLSTASALLYLNPVHTRLFWPAFLFGPFIALGVRDLWAGRQAAARIRLKFAEGEPR